MPRYTLIVATFSCLAGCINTSASYDGQTVSFSTQRLFSDTGIESAALQLQGDGRASLEVQGYQSDHSKALEIARQALSLMAPEPGAGTTVAAESTSLFEAPAPPRANE